MNDDPDWIDPERLKELARDGESAGVIPGRPRVIRLPAGVIAAAFNRSTVVITDCHWFA